MVQLAVVVVADSCGRCDRYLWWLCRFVVFLVVVIVVEVGTAVGAVLCVKLVVPIRNLCLP